MSSSFCPRCGTPRVGGFRFCRSCPFDFDDIDRATGAGASLQTPVPQPSPPPPSYSEKYAGTPWTTTTTTPAVVARRRGPLSPRGALVVVAVGLAGAVAGLGLILATRGGGVFSPAAPSSTTSAATSATEQPGVAPTPAPSLKGFTPTGGNSPAVDPSVLPATPSPDATDGSDSPERVAVATVECPNPGGPLPGEGTPPPLPAEILASLPTAWSGSFSVYMPGHGQWVLAPRGWLCQDGYAGGSGYSTDVASVSDPNASVSVGYDNSEVGSVWEAAPYFPAAAKLLRQDPSNPTVSSPPPGETWYALALDAVYFQDDPGVQGAGGGSPHLTRGVIVYRGPSDFTQITCALPDSQSALCGPILNNFLGQLGVKARVSCLSDPEGSECHAAIYTDSGPPVTPKPTAKPTAKPTPKPTANPLAGTTRFMDYIERQATRAAPEIRGIVSSLSIDAEYGDDAGFRTDGARLEKRVNSEIVWMKARRPQPCYTSLWKVRLAYYEDLAKAGRYAKAGDWSSFSKNLDLSTKHDQEINDNGMVDEAGARCDANPGEPG